MILLQTIIVYTLLGILMFYFAKQANIKQNHQTLYNLIPIILYTLVMGFRYGVGVDYGSYAEIYTEELHDSSLKQMFETRYEKGFTILVYLCHLITDNTWIFFIVTSCLEISLLYLSFQKFPKVLPYIYIAFVFSGVALTGYTNVIRQAIAFGIFTYSLKFISERQFLPYLALCLIAISFHISAVILIPLYFVWIRRNDFFHRPKLECIIFISCFLIGVFTPINQILADLDNFLALLNYERYVDNMENFIANSKIGPTRLTMLLANLIIIFKSQEIKTYYNNKLINIYYDVFFVGACCNFLFLGSMMLLRMVLYFTYFLFIFYGFAINYYKDNVYLSKRISIGYVAIVFALLVSYTSYIYSYKTNTVAYVTCFQTDLHSIKDYYLEIK